MSSTPIGAHALLSDCHSSALVDSSGSVEWLTFPRFDSPAVMARLLDDKAGHWSIRPIGDFSTSRRYLDGTMVLETTFRTSSGTVVLTDALAMGPDNEGHALGRDAPHVLVRGLSCVEGEVEVELSVCAPAGVRARHTRSLAARGRGHRPREVPSVSCSALCRLVAGRWGRGRTAASLGRPCPPICAASVDVGGTAGTRVDHR